MLQSDIRRDDRGVDRCSRTVMQAVHNVPNDDSKGFHNVAAVCNMPIVQRISDGVKGCSRCDKEPPVGNVHPRTTNAAGINLTPKELEECGLKEDYTKIEVVKAEPVINTQAMEAPVEKDRIARKDAVGIEVSLDLLEQCDDVPALLIKGMIESMDNLPVTNFKESKRLIKLQEKLEALLRV
jgi:hypothetical protein